MKKTITCICVLGGLIGIALLGDTSRATDKTAINDVGITVSPSTIVLGVDKGDRVTVHTDIPLAVVDRSSLTLNDVPPILVKADSRGNLVAKFDQLAIEATITPPEDLLVLLGMTKDGDSFSGCDSVRVIDDPSP